MTARTVLLYLPGTKATAAPDLYLPGWSVHVARGVSEAKERVESGRERVGLALIDSIDESTLSKIHDIVCLRSHMAWIALVSKEWAVRPEVAQIVSQCFYDYHTTPPDPGRLLMVLGHAHGMATLRGASATAQTIEGGDEFQMVGTSSRMQSVFAAIRRIGSVDAPVLITGESGTGKELAALAIHERSHRAQGPFVAVNCSALPHDLIHSELFGHEKGAFTGAHARRMGRVEMAAGGTVFLDEIGDLPLDLQVYLLRFLQEHTIERLGNARPITVDVRVIAATHVDLEEAMRAGRFREDLYYRLNVLRLDMPSLREREGDMEILARFFFDKFARTERTTARGFSRQALDAMKVHSWPGNVRELINRVRRAIVMCEHRLISPADLGLERRQSTRSMLTLETVRALGEKQAISQALWRTTNNVTQAARELGVSRMTLYRLMEKHHLAMPRANEDGSTQGSAAGHEP
jgi:DNA-binding NtrC family response regulator